MAEVKIDSLADWAFRALTTVPMNRYEKLKDDLEEEVSKRTRKLFRIMAGTWDGVKAVDVPQNPFRGRPWPGFSKRYLKTKRKHHMSGRFWVLTRKLQNWLKTADVEAVWGQPYIVMTPWSEPNTPLWKSRIHVEPFPNSEPENMPDYIYQRFYSKHNGISNEDKRPIMSKSMQNIVNRQLKQMITRRIKKTMEQGD